MQYEYVCSLLIYVVMLYFVILLLWNFILKINILVAHKPKQFKIHNSLTVIAYQRLFFFRILYIFNFWAFQYLRNIHIHNLGRRYNFKNFISCNFIKTFIRNFVIICKLFTLIWFRIDNNSSMCPTCFIIYLN